MVYSYNDFLQYIPDLKKYVRSKIKTDTWKDVVQDTLIYLYMKFDKLIITDLKGLIINTARFFINKHFRVSKIEYSDVLETKYMFAVTDSMNPVFKIGSWNGNDIDDRLYSNIKRVSKTLMEPFEMQMNDKTVKEISQELELNENTVKTRIKRCKEFLKQGL
jgi:DNA-directed RNA polymerase specialized sigma24 family protein